MRVIWDLVRVGSVLRAALRRLRAVVLPIVPRSSGLLLHGPMVPVAGKGEV